MSTQVHETRTIFDIFSGPKTPEPRLAHREVIIGGVALWEPLQPESIFPPIPAHSPTEGDIAQRGLWRHLNIVYKGAHKRNNISKHPGLMAVFNTIYQVDGFRIAAFSLVDDLDEATFHNFGGLRRAVWQLSPGNQEIVVDRLGQYLVAAAHSAENPWSNGDSGKDITPGNFEEIVQTQNDSDFLALFKLAKTEELRRGNYWGAQIGSVRTHGAVEAVFDAIERADPEEPLGIKA